VGFTIEIHYDARSYKCKTFLLILRNREFSVFFLALFFTVIWRNRWIKHRNLGMAVHSESNEFDCQLMSGLVQYATQSAGYGPLGITA